MRGDNGRKPSLSEKAARSAVGIIMSADRRSDALTGEPCSSLQDTPETMPVLHFAVDFIGKKVILDGIAD
jgi:hypothetical protein